MPAYASPVADRSRNTTRVYGRSFGEPCHARRAGLAVYSAVAGVLRCRGMVARRSLAGFLSCAFAGCESARAGAPQGPLRSVEWLLLRTSNDRFGSISPSSRAGVTGARRPAVLQGWRMIAGKPTFAGDNQTLERGWQAQNEASPYSPKGRYPRTTELEAFPDQLPLLATPHGALRAAGSTFACLGDLPGCATCPQPRLPASFHAPALFPTPDRC